MRKIINILNKNWFEKLAITSILIGAFVIRVIGLNFLPGLDFYIDNPVASWHSWRQADTISVSEIYVNEGVNLLFPKYYDISRVQTGYFNPEAYRFVEFPIYNYINVLAYKTFPQLTLEVWAKLISILCAVLTCFFLYSIGKKFINKWGGLAAAFFYAFIPFNIYFTSVILPEPMAVMFAVGSIYFFAKFTEKEKRIYLFLSSLFFAGGMLLKPFIIFYALPIAYLAIKKFGFRNIFRRIDLMIAIDIALIPFFLWRIWMNKFPWGIPFFEWAFNGDKIRFKPAFWNWIFVERLGTLVLGVWGLFPFIAGTVRKNNLFIQLMLLGAFGYVSVIATASVRHDYYQTLIIPAVVLALGAGCVSIWKSPENNKALSRGLLIFAVLLMLMKGMYVAREFYKINHPEILEAGKVASEILPKDAKVLAPYNGDTAFLYQIKRYGWPIVDDSFENLIKLGADYYISVNFADPDTINLRRQYSIVKEEKNYIIIDLHKPLKN